MLAFHYAHTDAVHSMQHFDLQPQHAHTDAEATNGDTVADSSPADSQPLHAENVIQANVTSASVNMDVVGKEQVIQQVCA